MDDATKQLIVDLIDMGQGRTYAAATKIKEQDDEIEQLRAGLGRTELRERLEAERTFLKTRLPHCEQQFAKARALAGEIGMECEQIKARIKDIDSGLSELSVLERENND